MAVAYHTHVFEIPTATNAEVAAGVVTDKVVTPSVLGSAAAEDASAFLQPADIGSDVQAYSVNLDEVSTVNPGAAGLAILADAQTDDVRSYLATGPYVADITALKDLDATKDIIAFLPEEASFDWRAGDATADAAFDPNGHMVVKADDLPLTTGAWYRRLKGENPGLRDAFKCKGDGSTDDTNAIEDAIGWMEFYPLRSRSIVVERGQFMTENLEIPQDITGISFDGQSHWNSCLVNTVADGTPAILNKSQEFKMFDVTLMSTQSNATNWANLKHGLKNLKDYSPTVQADVDCILDRVRIAGFYRGVYQLGRSLVVRSGQFSGCDWAIELDWPDVGAYEAELDQQSDDLGFRGFLFADLRIHSPLSGFLKNDGTNAYKIRGLSVKDIDMDIGRSLFQGHLGVGAQFANLTSFISPTTAMSLTGGANFNIDNISLVGRAPYDTNNLIRFEAGAAPGVTTGIYRAGILSNIQCAISVQTPIVAAASTQLLGVEFNDCMFDGVGTSSPSTRSAIQLNSPNSHVTVNRPVMIASANRLSFVNVGSTTTSSVVEVNDVVRVGAHTTPAVSGSAAGTSIIIDGHQTYTATPVIAGGTNPSSNITSAAAITADFVKISDDIYEVMGRFTVTATTAAACVMKLNLPVASNFATSDQAWGSFNCTTTNVNVGGGVLSDATNDLLEIRFTPPNTGANTYSFKASYKIL